MNAVRSSLFPLKTLGGLIRCSLATSVMSFFGLGVSTGGCTGGVSGSSGDGLGFGSCGLLFFLSVGRELWLIGCRSSSSSDRYLLLPVLVSSSSVESLGTQYLPLVGVLSFFLVG